jgi:hypothetical protein
VTYLSLVRIVSSASDGSHIAIVPALASPSVHGDPKRARVRSGVYRVVNIVNTSNT